MLAPALAQAVHPDMPPVAVRSVRHRAVSRALFVARDGGEPGHVLQQDAPALQIEDAVLAPGLQLTVDAFARGADEDAELLLRDVDLGAEIGCERTEPAR